MVLDRNSKLVKFSYSMSPSRYHKVYRPDGKYTYEGPSKIPPSGSLCAFFWRTFVLLPTIAISAVVAAVSGLYFLVEFLLTMPPLFWFYVVGGTVLTVLFIFGLVTLITYIEHRPRKRRERRERVYKPALWESQGWKAFSEGFKTIKGKVCPIIEFTNTSSSL